MKRRPRALIFLAMVLLAIAVSFPLQIMGLYGHGPSEVEAILNKLTVMNWLVMLGLLVTAVWAFEASPRLQYAMPAMIGLVAINNFFVGYHGTDYSPWMASVATFAFGVTYWPLSVAEVRFILDHPEQRWWRISARKNVQLPVTLSRGKDHRVRGETFDLSESGMFVPLPNPQSGLEVSQTVSVVLQLGSFAQIRCDGRVVRQCNARGRYPSGVGVEFIGLSNTQRHEIKRYLSRRPLELQ